jgi:adenylate cyclase class IV
VSRPLLSSTSPADELEVKARVDDPDGLRAALVRAGASLDFRGDMIDRRFDQGGSLAQRNEVLRLREFRAADGTPAYGVLGWKGPPSLRGLYRHRAEAEARVATPDSVVTILEQLGFTVSLRIDRRVEVYRLGHAVLRLEWYPAMDVLLEVEGEPPAIERAIAATGLARDRFLAESLPYFVSQYEARTGRAALLAR